MAVPIGSRVYTGPSGEMSGYGKGAAYVPDSTATLEIISQGLKDIRENERLKREEAQKKANAWNSLLEETPDVWEIDFEKVNEKSLAYTDYVISLKERGYDPYNLPSNELKELNRLKTEVIREANAAKANKEYWDKNTMTINTDADKKFDKGYATNFFKAYTDPNMSPTERAKYRMENDPYLKNVNLTDIIVGIYEKMPLEENTVGNKIIQTKDEEKFKPLLDIYLNSDNGIDDYESLMKRGDYSSNDALVEDALKIFRSINEKSVKDKPKTGSTTTKDKEKEKESGYGTGNWDGKFSITYGKDDAYPPAKEANTIHITRTGPNDDLPFINLLDDNGKLIQFQPTTFYLKNNEISVRGFKKENGKDVDTYISYNKNKEKLKSQMNGYDVMEDFIKINDPNANTGTSTSTGSTRGQKTLAELMKEQNK